MLNVVDESSNKDGFSTSGWSRHHAGKLMGPRHEVIGSLPLGILNTNGSPVEYIKYGSSVSVSCCNNDNCGLRGGGGV